MCKFAKKRREGKERKCLAESSSSERGGRIIS
jgi:hypothetical protein